MSDKCRRNNGIVTEKAHLNSNQEKYASNYDRIFSKKSAVTTYFDRFALMSDKPCVNGEQSSGNPSIYTAIFELVTGSKVDYANMFDEQMFIENFNNTSIFSILRHPDKPYITSIDEIIGLLHKRYINSYMLEKFDWRWHNQKLDVSFLRKLQAAIYCAGKGRNFFSDNAILDLHPWAYQVPRRVRYYAYRLDGRNMKALTVLIPYLLWCLTSLPRQNFDRHGDKLTGNISQKNILFVIFKDIKSPFIYLMNWKKNIKDYFGPDHYITKEIG